VEGYRRPPRLVAAAPAAPDAAAIGAAAQILSQARWPLIVTANAGRDTAAFAALAQFAERFAIPVVQHRPRYFSLPSSHPMNLGFEPARFVPDADVILVLECDVPWIASRTAPRADCKVIQCGIDPLFTRYPIRGFPCDVAIAAGAAPALTALAEALAPAANTDAVEQRRRRIDEQRAALAARVKAGADAGAHKSPLDPAWVSHCIGRARDPRSI